MALLRDPWGLLEPQLRVHSVSKLVPLAGTAKHHVVVITSTDCRHSLVHGHRTGSNQSGVETFLSMFFSHSGLNTWTRRAEMHDFERRGGVSSRFVK